VQEFVRTKHTYLPMLDDVLEEFNEI